MNYNLQTLLALTIVQESEEHIYGTAISQQENYQARTNCCIAIC